ncbi:MAG: radical SAM protein, partial [Candidatus Omnitrophota bacterium]
MNILLVKPYNLSDHIQPSLGLGYLATSIRLRHKVEILDCIKEKMTPRLFGYYMEKTKPQIVGIQCYTFDLYNIRKMLRSAKRIGAVTILGGPHPSAVPLETMDFFRNKLDYAFQGEAEIGFSKLVDKLAGIKDYSFEDIEGLIWRKNGHIQINEKHFIKDIDSLGGVSWDLIKPQTYPPAQHGAFYKNFPIAPIIVTRGCPYLCTFCAGNLISGKMLRKRSVQNVISEIKMLHDDFGIREFHIVDDNFTLDKAYVNNFLRTLKAMNLNMSWSVPNGIRMDTLDDEMLELMKETGLYLISLGIESGSDRILDLMKKNITVDKIKSSIALIRRHGIEIAGFFIVGFPGETKKDIEQTIDLSLELDLIRANFFIYLPLPGSESFESLKRDGKLGHVNLKKFLFMIPTYTPELISKDELKRLQRKAFLKFFLRPKILIRNLMQIKSLRHFKYLSARFFRWILMKE